MTEKSKGTAVQFGAGNIGRGLIGVLLSQAGYDLVFVDVIEPLVEQINRRGKYTLREVTATEERDIIVENVRAIDGRAEAEVVEAISRASLVTTAVGPNVLPVVAPVIAKGLQRRAELKLEPPVNIIACENLIDNSKILQEHVLDHLPDSHRRYVETHAGFPRCVVDRVVTIPGEAEREADPLLVVAEGEGQLVVDRFGFAGEPPDIPGMQLTDKLAAYVEQKIFTLNTGHAIAAYLGYQYGYEFIHEAMRDPAIYRVVLGTFWEFGPVLIKRHQLDPVEQQQFGARVLGRFENATLPDPVVRVARDPKRKLAPGDRLIKPAQLALEAGITPTYLATGIAAALLYDHPDDPEAMALSQALREQGLDQVLAEVCGLPSGHALARLVRQKTAKAIKLMALL